MPHYAVAPSTAALVVLGRRRPGIPMILKAGRLEPASSWYLVERAVHQGRGPKAVRANAYAVRRWFEFLHENGVHWRAAILDDAVRFSERHSGPDGAGRATAARLLRQIAAFYRWAWERGLILARPFRIGTPPRGARAGVPLAPDPTPLLVLPRPFSRKPRFLPPGLFYMLRAALPLRDVDLRERTDAALDYGWQTGLRISEVTFLTVPQILLAIAPTDPFARTPPALPDDPLAALDASPEPAFVVTLDPAHTKGGVGGEIIVPRLLMRRTVEWIIDGRRRIVARAEKRSTTYRDPGHLFLSRTGAPLTAGDLGHQVRCAAIAANLSVTFHDLRRSFAMRFAAAAEAHGFQRWPEALQELLHHADPDSQRCYLSGLADPAMRQAAQLIAVHLATE